jgi:outer membrane protein OmpA-like peptidoglycan-associated protein
LGHEDLSPITRSVRRGGWDPGFLRDAPFFDWNYVYEQIEQLVEGTALTSPEPWSTPAPAPTGPTAGNSGLTRVLGASADRFVTLVERGELRNALELARQHGVKKENDFTNLVFFERHPEMQGRRIRKDETHLAAEWTDIREKVVRPFLQNGVQPLISGSPAAHLSQEESAEGPFASPVESRKLDLSWLDSDTPFIESEASVPSQPEPDEETFETELVEMGRLETAPSDSLAFETPDGSDFEDEDDEDDLDQSDAGLHEEESSDDIEHFFFSSSATEVEFPEITLPAVDGATGPFQEHWDPFALFTGQPLLDTGRRFRSKLISRDFDVGEFAQTGKGKVKFDKARIDPKLVECLQELRDRVRRPVVILDGYYSFKHLQGIAKRKKVNSVPISPHQSGQAAKIRVQGRSGLELAKEAVFACGQDTRISVGSKTIVVNVGQADTDPTSYIRNGEEKERAVEAVSLYRTLFFDAPPDILSGPRKEIGDAHREYAHWAVQAVGVRDAELIAEMMFEISTSYQSFWLDQGETQEAKRELLDHILTTWVHPQLGGAPTTQKQRGSDPRAPKGERVLADPEPDAPSVDLTGRWEWQNEPTAPSSPRGATLQINQAGTHIQVVYSPVLGPKHSPDMKRPFRRLHGDLENEGSFRLSSLQVPDQHLKLTFRDDELEVETLAPLKPAIFVAKRRSKLPVLMETALGRFTEGQDLVSRMEWRPLLTKQVRGLREFFSDRDRIVGYLDDFFKIQGDTGQHFRETLQKRSIEKFISAVSDVVRHPSSGIHEGDVPLARFIIRYHLSRHRWRPNVKDIQFADLKVLPRFPELSLYDWINRMAGAAASAAEKKHLSLDLELLKTYLGVQTADPNAHRHRYRIKLELKGVTVKAIVGIGGYSASLTVEKVDSQPWPEGEATFTGILFAISTGVGVNLKKTIEGEVETTDAWLPGDFVGRVNVILAEASAEAGVKAEAEAQILHIYGSEIFDELQVVNSGSDASLSSDDAGISAGLSLVTGSLGRSGMRPDVIYPSTKVRTDYAAAYKLTDTVHFGFNSAILSPSARQLIRILCANELPAFRSRSSVLQIDAHTDRVGKRKDNLTLSTLRAANTQQAIEDVLGSELGIPDDRIHASGRGEEAARQAGDEDGKRNQVRRKVDLTLNSELVLTLRG